MAGDRLPTGTLTPRSANVVSAYRFAGDFGQPDGFTSVLEAVVRRSGALCLTLTWRQSSGGGVYPDDIRRWFIELTDEQRRALAEVIRAYEPRTWEAIKQNEGTDTVG